MPHKFNNGFPIRLESIAYKNTLKAIVSETDAKTTMPETLFIFANFWASSN